VQTKTNCYKLDVLQTNYGYSSATDGKGLQTAHVINSPARQCRWDRRRVRYCPCPRGRPHSRAHIGRPAYGAAPVLGPTLQLDSSRTGISEKQWEPVVEDFVQCT